MTREQAFSKALPESRNYSVQFSGTKFSCARIARKPCARASHCVPVHPDIFASHPALFVPNTKPNSKSKIFRSVMFPFLSLLTNRLPFQL